MSVPPKVKMICDPKAKIDFSDLDRIFTLSGLLLTGIKRTGEKAEIEFTKGNRLSKSLFIKLFKQLKREYNISEISIAKDDWRKFEKFAEEYSLLGSGSNVRSYITIKDNRVTKVYLKPEPFLKNEILARKKIGHLKAVTPILEHGDNYIIMPLLKIYYQWNNEKFPTLFPLKVFDKIFEFVNEVYACGFCLVDWNPEGFIYSNNEVYMIDFEYFYEHSCPDNYPISPDITGIGQERTTTAGDVVTFNKDWERVLGLTYEDYCTLTIKQKRLKRRIHYWTRLLPSYVNAQLNICTKFIRNSIRYKLTDRGDTICIRSRL